MNLLSPVREFMAAVPAQDTIVATATIAAATSGAASLVTYNWTMQLFGISPYVFFLCFCGAVIALRFLPKMNRAGIFSALGIGTVSSASSATWLADVVGTQRIGAIGFLTGLLAYLVLSILFENAATFIKKWVDFRTGGK